MINIPSSYGRLVTHTHRNRTMHGAGWSAALLPEVDTILSLVETRILPDEVDKALVLLHSILKGKASVGRDERIRLISTIYDIVFLRYDRMWRTWEFHFLIRVFKYVSLSPFNTRSLWIKWRPYHTALDFVYVDKALNNPKDSRYLDHMNELVDSIEEEEKDEIFDTHHPCEYERAMGITGPDAMDFSSASHIGKEEATIHLFDQ